MKNESNPQAAVMPAYQLYMLTGQTSLEDVQSTRYTDIKLMPFSDFLAENVPASAAQPAAELASCQ
jgi:hypothetical protein